MYIPKKSPQINHLCCFSGTTIYGRFEKEKMTLPPSLIVYDHLPTPPVDRHPMSHAP